MNNPADTVFGHPEQRAQTLALPGVSDRLSLRDYEVPVEIGAFQLERGVTQRLRFNISVEISPVGEGAGDDVDAILSYDRITEAVNTELAAERLNLLETLAERIAARILAEPQALRVFLRIEKPDRGPFVLGLEIVREKGRVEVADTAGPEPLILLVPQDAAEGDLRKTLPTFIKRTPQPVVIVVEPEKNNAEYTGVAGARILLLKAEQAAWKLSEVDPGFDVIATRTELDWAMKNGRTAIWAPSRMLFDTPGAPVSGTATEQANWLAGELGAGSVVNFADL